MSKFEEYLKLTYFLDFDKKKVRNKALEITKSAETNSEKAIELFYWVRDKIKYNMMSYVPKIKANFKASVTLRRGYGFCVSKSILLASFGRAVDIPTRLHLVDIINHKISEKVVEFMGTNVMYYHGYAEFYLNERWIKLAPIFDKMTAEKAGFLPLTEFDGKNDALFSHDDLDGNIFVEYINDHGIYSDLPLKTIEKTFDEKYGSIFQEGLTVKPIKDKRITYK
ncbi:MAG: transglutaminase [Candidatus Lokiarchaeota archaeon]|nr:transglutaminase [Candidatus Lokiarchaeota archaeon]MBD3202284.1 transglutaminase [Candidatus Lokiarchaeota archaeon]